jgi:hypothetical protein
VVFGFSWLAEKVMNEPGQGNQVNCCQGGDC